MFENVDIPAVVAELETYVAETEPVNQSGGGLITARSGAKCGRARAIELTERVRPILDALYPAWRDESPEHEHFEFGASRDACSRLLARIASRQTISDMLGGLDDSPRLAANELHHLVWRAASAQWSTGHRHEAVLAGAKAVNSMLQTKLNRRDLSDVKLVQEALSEKEPEPAYNKRRLRFPTIEDDQTRESMRQGVMSFGVGCFQAIRNPVGHLPNEHYELSEQEALERLAALSLLARWIDQAAVVPLSVTERAMALLEASKKPTT